MPFKLRYLLASCDELTVNICSCAVENAGFEMGQVNSLTDADQCEIIRHIDAIIDGQLIDTYTDAEWQAVKDFCRSISQLYDGQSAQLV